MKVILGIGHVVSREMLGELDNLWFTNITFGSGVRLAVNSDRGPLSVKYGSSYCPFFFVKNDFVYRMQVMWVIIGNRFPVRSYPDLFPVPLTAYDDLHHQKYNVYLKPARHDYLCQIFMVGICPHKDQHVIIV